MTETSPCPSGFATVMAHFDLGPYAEARGRLALDLADRFGARFVGVAAEPAIAPAVTDFEAIGVQASAEEERRFIEQDLSVAKKAFQAVAGGRDDVEWRSAVAIPDRFLIEQSRAADIVVVGRRASYDVHDLRLGVRPGLVAMECGRPVLIVPPEKDSLLCKRAVVAWKDTREARRAMRDALPILRRCHEVAVVSASATMRDESAEDVAGWLRRHEVPAEPRILGGQIASIAEELLDVAGEMGADLIVSGAYGHSRTREWFFGGVTRDLLETSQACLLMSH